MVDGPTIKSTASIRKYQNTILKVVYYKSWPLKRNQYISLNANQCTLYSIRINKNKKVLLHIITIYLYSYLHLWRYLHFLTVILSRSKSVNDLVLSCLNYAVAYNYVQFICGRYGDFHSMPVKGDGNRV